MRRTLMLVEDDPSLRASLQTTLHPYFDLVSVSTAEAALRLMADIQPLDALLTDLHLGSERGTTGLQLALQFRIRQAGGKLVIMSGEALSETEIEQLHRELQGSFLSKPFASQDLLAALGCR